MRRVIRKRIRHREDGLDLAIDFNADVAINVGGSRGPADPPEPEADREPEPEPPEERKDP